MDKTKDKIATLVPPTMRAKATIIPTVTYQGDAAS